MSDETGLDDAIRENAAGPKSAEVDGRKVEQHSLKDHAHVTPLLHFGLKIHVTVLYGFNT